MKKIDTPKIDKDAIGIEVSWSFGDGDAEAVRLPRQLVQDALEEHGFNAMLIPQIDPDEALRRALQTVKGRSKRIVIQELRRPHKDTPRAVGVYEVRGKEGERGDDMVCGARVRIEGGRAVALAPEGAPSIPTCLSIAQDLERLANSLLDNVINRDLSDALVSIGWSLLWITRRRNSGGVYFVPRGPDAERFTQLLFALRDATQNEKRCHQFIPQVMEVYAKPLTMVMWTDSARDQYDAWVSELEAELARMTEDGKMRDSTIEKRAAECDRLIAQAEQHRMFLQGHVEVLAGSLGKIRDKFRAKLEEAGAALRDTLETLESQQGPAPKAPKAQPAPKPKAPARTVLDMSDEELFTI